MGVPVSLLSQNIGFVDPRGKLTKGGYDYLQGQTQLVKRFTPTLAAATGAITTVGTVAGWYAKMANLVVGEVDVTITTNGTGATSLTIGGLPYVAVEESVAVGRIVTVNTMVSGRIAKAASSITAVTLYDGTYPGADGRRLILGFSYLI
jgi:hypothetical protein